MRKQKYKAGNEFLPFHPQASHVSPDYRDGWNACWQAAIESREPAKDVDMEALKRGQENAEKIWTAEAIAEVIGNESQWQPIETAPKDEGKLLLGWVDGLPIVICWESPCSDHPELYGWCHFKNEDDYGEPVFPTHWTEYQPPKE
jgi:hypothetical protein